MQLIKIGGGLIAPKKFPEETCDLNKITEICGQLKSLWDSGERFVLINGSGNFGHSWAKKYDIQNGFTSNDKDKVWGAARTQFSASKINRIVVEQLLNLGLPAVILSPHDLDTYKKLQETINLGLLPVLYGDVIWDENKGCEIFSGEMVIQKILETDMRFEKIVQLSIEKGVWDFEKNIIPEITEKNWDTYKSSIQGSLGVDVTGGMLHKVETSLQIAKKYKIPTYITNSIEKTKEGTRII